MGKPTMKVLRIEAQPEQADSAKAIFNRLVKEAIDDTITGLRESARYGDLSNCGPAGFGLAQVTVGGVDFHFAVIVMAYPEARLDDIGDRVKYIFEESIKRRPPKDPECQTVTIDSEQ